MRMQFLNLMDILRDRRGVTALEYGIVAAALTTVIVYGFTLFGTNLTLIFSGVGGSI